MAEQVSIRLADVGDETEFWRACVGYDPRAADLPAEVVHARYLRLVQRDDNCLPMAVQNDHAVGYAMAQDYGPNLRLRFTIGRVHDLYVAPEARRHGVGRMLMEQVFAWARERPEPMILEWQASPGAVAVYEALGFQADRVGDYPEYPGFSLDLRPAPEVPLGL